MGALIVVFAEFYVSQLTKERWPLILGILFVAVIMYFRGGIVVALVRLRKRLEG